MPAYSEMCIRFPPYMHAFGNVFVLPTTAYGSAAAIYVANFHHLYPRCLYFFFWGDFWFCFVLRGVTHMENILNSHEILYILNEMVGVVVHLLTSYFIHLPEFLMGFSCWLIFVYFNGIAEFYETYLDECALYRGWCAERYSHASLPRH